MRPIASTPVASMQNIAAPDSASELMWVKCQSVAEPSTAEYWHIGATMMRLLSFRSRRWIGEKSVLMLMSGRWEDGLAQNVASHLLGLNPLRPHPSPYGLMPAALVSSKLAATSRTYSSAISFGLSRVGSVPSLFRVACVAGSFSTFMPAA